MAQVVPSEIVDTCFFQAAFPYSAADAVQFFTVVLGKYIHGATFLLLQNVEGGLIEWNANSLSAFGLVGIYPCGAPLDVYLFPLQFQHVALA